MNQFSELGVSSPLLKSLENMGFENPTAIQRQAIPLLNHNHVDFIGIAQTGTGKTAAFGLPLLQLVDVSVPAIQALIVAPTRELGQQIAGQLKIFGKEVNRLNVQVVYGGAPINTQIRLLKNIPQIVVATPGRLIDLLGRKALNLKHIRYVVLDEADEMLNMGFKDSIDKILSKTPQDKRTWLFSATMSAEIRNIVKNYMTDPVEMRVEGSSEVNENIDHHYLLTKADQKANTLRRLLDENPDMSGVIFCRTKRETKNLARELTRSGYAIDAMHGDLTQKQRDWVMKKFRDRTLKLIAATDVVARGMDIKNLSHVIHFSLPDDLEYYTHRSGRTARAGKEGKSIALATKGDEKRIRLIEKKLNIRINKMENDFEPVETDRFRQPFAEIRDRRTKEKFGERRGGKRFFINVGKIDDFSKKELLHLVCNQSGIAPEKISDIEMHDKHSFFNLSGNGSRLERVFKGFQLKGRSLRVNEDTFKRRRFAR